MTLDVTLAIAIVGFLAVIALILLSLGWAERSDRRKDQAEMPDAPLPKDRD